MALKKIKLPDNSVVEVQDSRIPAPQSTDNGKVLGVTSAAGAMGWVEHVGSDHTRAEADHTQADSDHTQAAADHAIMQNYDDRLAVVEGEVEAGDLESVEDGEFHTGPNLDIAYQYTAAGFDAAKISAHFLSLIAAGLCITDMEEEGFAIVGEDLGIVLLVNGTGVHAPNLVEYQNV